MRHERDHYTLFFQVEQEFGQAPTEDDLPVSQYILLKQPLQELVAQRLGAECQQLRHCVVQQRGENDDPHTSNQALQQY